MADLTITIDVSDVAAAAALPAVISPGQAPTIDWGTLPTPKIDWGRSPWDPQGPAPPSASIDTTNASPPSIDMTNATPPTVTLPTPADLLNAIGGALTAAGNWTVTVR